MRLEQDPVEISLRQTMFADKRAALMKDATETYGPILGPRFADYILGNSDIEARTQFAETVVSTLEGGTHEEKTQALTALLEAIEIKIQTGIKDAKRPEIY